MRTKTEAELISLRRHTIKQYNMSKKTEFACDDCDVRHRCRFVYNIYNINGGCLAIEQGEENDE